MTSATSKDMHRPTALDVCVDGIPDSLKAEPRWVAWKFQLRKTKWTKVPFDANTGTMADSTDPETWCDFHTAYMFFFDPANQCDGIGFVLGDRFIGFDFDDAIDPASGELKPWASRHVKALDSYTEVSPSGEGVKVIVKSAEALPGEHHRIKVGDGEIEVYESARYFCCTGNVLEPFPASVNERTKEAADVYKNIFAEKLKKTDRVSSKAPPSTPSASDAEIIAQCEKYTGPDFRRLWTGDLSAAANDHSLADYKLTKKLVWRCGPNPDMVDRLFRQSGLMRDKWDSRRGTATYGQRTIDNAIATATRFFDPSRNGTRAKPSPSVDPIDEQQAEQAPQNQEQKNQEHIAAPETEFALAEELVRRHGQDLRHCGQHKAWYVWDGRRWAEDETGEACERSKDTSKAIYRECVGEFGVLSEQLKNASEDEKPILEKRIATLKSRMTWARKSQTRDKVNACLAIASSVQGIAIRASDFDRNLFLFNVNNGTIDLTTGELRPHNRNDLITKLAPVDYDANAKAPHFEKFLTDIFPNTATGDAAEEVGNEALITFIQRALGYSITGNVSEHILLVFFGTGANGKSTLIEVVLSILGDYGMSAPPTLLMAKDHQEHPTALADLFGRRFVSTSETKAGGYLDEALVKWLTGGDTIRARRMKENFWEFTPTHQVILSTNHRPRLRNPNDDAMKRRLRLVPFAVKFWNPDEPPAPGEERPETRKRDPKLLGKLKAEAPGILAWLVNGCVDWQRKGLGTAPEVSTATNDYIADQDVVGDFLAERCKLNTDCKSKASQLYTAFAEWAKASGEQVVTLKEFGRRIGLKPGIERYANNGTWYRGIGLMEMDA